MRKIYTIARILFVLLVLASTLESSWRGGSKVITISSIKEAKVYFNRAGRKTLIIFDVDSTLTTVSDPDLRRQSIQHHHAIYDELVSPLTPNQKRIFNHLLVMESPSQLVEEDFPKLIRFVQKKGAWTLAFTAAKTGAIGVMPSFPEWRYQELKRLGIDFSEYYPKNILFTKLSDYGGDFPGIERGIVYSGHKCDKGEVLILVLEEISWVLNHIEEIIFIDDKEENVLLFAKVLNESYPHINFIGLVYNGIEAMLSPEVSASIFREKFSKLIEKTKEICPE